METSGINLSMYVSFQQGHQENTMGKEYSLQKIALRKPGLQKRRDDGHLSYTLHKIQVKMNQRTKYQT